MLTHICVSGSERVNEKCLVPQQWMKLNPIAVCTGWEGESFGDRDNISRHHHIQRHQRHPPPQMVEINLHYNYWLQFDIPAFLNPSLFAFSSLSTIFAFSSIIFFAFLSQPSSFAFLNPSSFAFLSLFIIFAFSSPSSLHSWVNPHHLHSWIQHVFLSPSSLHSQVYHLCILESTIIICILESIIFVFLSLSSLHSRVYHLCLHYLCFFSRSEIAKLDYEGKHFLVYYHLCDVRFIYYQS